MSIDWTGLDQPSFDRFVEALVRYRFGEQAHAVNGSGGDEGIDIAITLRNGRLWIMQLKFYPEGFSSMYGKRRQAIKHSFERARQHRPARWTLVVPCLCKGPERKYVENLNGGKRPPRVDVVDRDDLDAWAADAPWIDRYFQRNATSELRQMAREFGQERAALLGGVPDLQGRVRNLGKLVDSLDLDWAVDFAQRGSTTSVMIRPRDRGAASRSPIGFTVEGVLGEEHGRLHQQLLRNIGYGTSEPLHIPAEVVRSVRFSGPEFIAGEYPAGAVNIPAGPSGPGVGEQLELRAYQEDTLVASYEGLITYAAAGEIGGSIDADFCDGHLKVRLLVPYVVEPASDHPAYTKPTMDLALNYGSIRPAAAEDALSTHRVLCFATHLKAYIKSQHLFTMRINDPPETGEDYDEDLLAFEQFAYDLDVVQQHTGRFFNMPDELRPSDRVQMRVARLLIERYIVASPRAPEFTLAMTGANPSEIRASLLTPGQLIWPAGPYGVTIAGRELTIGDVYVIHPEAAAVNTDEAIAALDANQADGFLVHFRPGNDPYFYLTLADESPDDVVRRSISEWSLFGVAQPGTPPDGPACSQLD